MIKSEIPFSEPEIYSENLTVMNVDTLLSSENIIDSNIDTTFFFEKVISTHFILSNKNRTKKLKKKMNMELLFFQLLAQNNFIGKFYERFKEKIK
jgi:hypothetical protein